MPRMILDDLFRSPDKVTERLRKARDLVAAPKGWHQGSLAISSRDWRVGASHPDASSFCAYGAILKAGGSHKEVEALESALAKGVKGFVIGVNESIVEWNDKSGRRQDEVVQAFDKAIRRRAMMSWLDLAYSIAIRFVITAGLLVGLMLLMGCQNGTGGHCVRTPTGVVLCDTGQH